MMKTHLLVGSKTACGKTLGGFSREYIADWGHYVYTDKAGAVRALASTYGNAVECGSCARVAGI